MSLHKVFVPETRDVFVEELIAIAEGRTSFEAETVLQTLTGERLTVLFTIAFPSPRARFDSVLVTLTDITERKRAGISDPAGVRERPDAVYVIGRDYRFQRVNPVYGQLWGMPPQRIVAMHIAELLGADVFEHTIKAESGPMLRRGRRQLRSVVRLSARPAIHGGELFAAATGLAASGGRPHDRSQPHGAHAGVGSVAASAGRARARHAGDDTGASWPRRSPTRSTSRSPPSWPMPMRASTGWRRTLPTSAWSA